MREIQLTKGMNAIVDDDDFELLSGFKWQTVCGGKYAARSTKLDGRKMIYMHRFIMGSPDGGIVDHKNGNTLDNRKENLRMATPCQNSWNMKPKNPRSGYKGVSMHTSGLWQARIRVNYKSIKLGYFRDPAEAHKAYCSAAIKYHGEFARTS